VDLVIYPDAGRAEFFSRQARLDKHPTVVMNCPRRLAKVPAESLAAKLAGRGMAGSLAVYFHGWVGPSRCIEAAIQSMRWWPKTAVFVIVGPVAENYRAALMALGGEVGVAERLVFLGSVPYAAALQLAAGATVGCSLVADQNDLNWTYSAGAINKRFEYMAVGLPQVANTGPGMMEIIEDTGCGLLANPQSAVEAGQAFARLLQDDALRARMGENARAAHLSRLNYEHQFAPALEQVITWCGH
jgi:glycosyltransferase involved in cell wall biosynthesis